MQMGRPSGASSVDLLPHPRFSGPIFGQGKMTQLHFVASHCIIHLIALHDISLYCMALHCMALRCAASYCVTWHCMTLHFCDTLPDFFLISNAFDSSSTNHSFFSFSPLAHQLNSVLAVKHWCFFQIEHWSALDNLWRFISYPAIGHRLN